MAVTGSPELLIVLGAHATSEEIDHVVSRLADAIMPVECVAESGGVVAMRPLLVHASSKARDAQPRRVLHIEYARSMEAGDGLRLAIA